MVAPLGGFRGETPRIGAGQYAGVARLSELRILMRYPCGEGLACRGLMSRESVPAGGQGGGRDFPPLAGFGAGPEIGQPGRSGAGVAGARLPRRVWGNAPRSGVLCFFEF